MIALMVAAALCNPPWPRLGEYVQAYVSGDGRVIERSARARTTSEGQAYALFFALVSDDRPLFDRLLHWTEANLAAGDLRTTLPAWEWGQRKDGGWGVLDRNSASDADLWLAYALVEAGRLWREPRYQQLGSAVLANVARREVADLPGLGPTLLPGPEGFRRRDGARLNPSYQPAQLLARFAAVAPQGPWRALQQSAQRLDDAQRVAAADWVLYRAGRGFVTDPEHGNEGSYDAIRTYLWRGMNPAAAAPQPALLDALERTGELPERIDARTLHTSGAAPVGFAGALLPLALKRNDGAAIRALRDRIARTPPGTYYDSNLLLFGEGFAEGRFRFAEDGELQPAWEAACQGSR